MPLRRPIARLLVLLVLALPLSGCSARDPVGQALFRTALGVGAAVGTYYLIQEIK